MLPATATLEKGAGWTTVLFVYFLCLQILRARLLHPDTPPQDLAKVDPELKAFMECREPDQEEQQGTQFA